jgi:hypothetical protein
MEELFHIISQGSSQAGMPRSISSMQYDRLAQFLSESIKIPASRSMSIQALLKNKGKVSDVSSMTDCNESVKDSPMVGLKRNVPFCADDSREKAETHSPNRLKILNSDKKVLKT